MAVQAESLLAVTASTFAKDSENFLTLYLAVKLLLQTKVKSKF